MAEIRDHALLLRRIPFSETSLICHFLTPEHGRISLMAKGARRAKSSFRGALAPLHPLSITWREGRTGMGTLTDIHRGSPWLEERKSLVGLELLSMASGLFQEGDPHGYSELLHAIEILGKRPESEGICASAWVLLHEAGWIGDLSHCWHCGEDVDDTQAMHWKSSQLLCQLCGGGTSISAGLRRGMHGVVDNDHVRLSVGDAMQWRKMIGLVLREHGVKIPESFR
jgi:DNA repair protein RecO